MNALVIRNAGKAYKQYSSHFARLLSLLNPMPSSNEHFHWVLKDINLSIAKGQAIGLVGVNGAGKSTLLKLIAGVSMPTEGEVEVQGRLASLLELGMGFKSEFTGRQNAILTGQLLGLSAHEIDALLPEIEAFSGIGRFIDEPIRIYSSGMLVRLAFSVVTAVRPDILIVDEALSVGDASFQQKCIQRIQAFCKSGTTLLLVSHDENTIISLCDEVVVLDAGRVVKVAPPKEAMDFYNALHASRTATALPTQGLLGVKPLSVEGAGDILRVLICEASNNLPLQSVNVGDPIELQIALRESSLGGILAYEIKNHLGECIFGFKLAVKPCHFDEMGDLTYHFSFPMNIKPGQYSISVALVSEDEQLLHRRYWTDLAYCFEVVSYDKDYFEGQAWLNAKVEISALT